MNERQTGSAGVEDDDAERAAAHRERNADERELLADKRETALDARELLTAAREAGDAVRRKEVKSILAGAEERDGKADARDSAAVKRDMAASLHSFLHDDEYDAAVDARLAAALDRSESKTDRDSAGVDRAKLTEDESERSG